MNIQGEAKSTADGPLFRGQRNRSERRRLGQRTGRINTN